MSLITFSCTDPSASWSPTHNPDYGDGNSRLVRRHQPRGRCGSDIYSYNKGASEVQYLKWNKLPSTDLATLLTFFETISGAVHMFTYTDHEGNAHTARLITSSLKHRHVDPTRHEVGLDLEVS
jgi:hypothetical protein